jgi:hypothetical protein
MFKSFFTSGLDTNFSGLILLGIPSLDGSPSPPTSEIRFPFPIVGLSSIEFNNTLREFNRVITNIYFTNTQMPQQRQIVGIFFSDSQRYEDVRITTISFQNNSTTQDRVITEIHYG